MVRYSSRLYAGSEEYFCDIDVAQPCDDRLVHKNFLDAPSARSKDARQVCPGKAIGDWLRTQASQFAGRIELTSRDDFHHAEMTLIGKSKPHPVVQLEDCVSMFRQLLPVPKVTEAARHSQMRYQSNVAIELGKYKFASADYILNRSILKGRGKFLSSITYQPGPQDFGVGNRRSNYQTS
jgi:hypothetical protein